MKDYEWDRIIYEYADRGCSELEENTQKKLSWARINGDKRNLKEAPGTNATVSLILVTIIKLCFKIQTFYCSKDACNTAKAEWTARAGAKSTQLEQVTLILVFVLFTNLLNK